MNEFEGQMDLEERKRFWEEVLSDWETLHGHEGPMTIGKQYTVGLGDLYAMRIDFEGWRGKAFTDAARWFATHTPANHIPGLMQRAKYEQLLEALGADDE